MKALKNKALRKVKFFSKKVLTFARTGGIINKLAREQRTLKTIQSNKKNANDSQ